MSQQETIRELWQNGKNKSEISRILSIDRHTVDTYLNKDDFRDSVADHVVATRKKKLDPYIEIIISALENEQKFFHKQRFTARRMHKYLCEDLKHEELRNSYQLVQLFMKHWKNEQKRNGLSAAGTLVLVWHAGEAQGDFGEADFTDSEGNIVRYKFFVLSFPFSNRIVCVVMPGENCECVCQSLQYIFEFIKAVPSRIVFDNATGIGRRVSSVLQEHEEFTRFRLHYGFTVTFCNPSAGYEKGCVENAVGTFRRNVMVPPLCIDRQLEQYNKEVMLDKSFAFRAEEEHYSKHVKISTLFEEDLKAMHDLPEKRFNVCSIKKYNLDSTGKLKIDNDKIYNLGPSCCKSTVLVEKTAWKISCYTLDGKTVKSFDRLYGNGSEQAYDLESILSRSWRKTNSWQNSIVQQQMSDGPFKDYLNSAQKKDLQDALFMFSQVSEEYGFGNACYALNKLAENGHLPTKDEARIFCERIATFPSDTSDNPTNVNLKGFDVLLNTEVNNAVR